jgi:adenylate kinase family enzyme
MKRVVLIGPGGSGKTTLARQLGEITGLPVIELDKIFWRQNLAATPRNQWVERQRVLVEQDQWIMDGDLGPYDALEVRLQAADTVLFLDFSPLRCAWRALRRSRERFDFWLWLLQYRRRSRPLILQAMATYAGDATSHVLRNPAAIRRFLADVKRASEAQMAEGPAAGGGHGCGARNARWTGRGTR